MSSKNPSCSRLRDKVSALVETTLLVLRALLHHRMGLVLPLVLVLILSACLGMILGLVSPLALLPRTAQVTPFIYPLF